MSPGGKGGRCVWLVTLTLSSANSLEILEASTARAPMAFQGSGSNRQKCLALNDDDGAKLPELTLILHSKNIFQRGAGY
jgi:hypothetical protein